MIEQHRFTAQHKGPMNHALYKTVCGLGAGASVESVCMVPASDSQAARQGGCWRSRDF